MATPAEPTLRRRLTNLVLGWLVVSACLFLAAAIGFRIIQGNWHDFGSWWPAFLVGAILGPPVGTALHRLGVTP